MKFELEPQDTLGKISTKFEPQTQKFECRTCLSFMSDMSEILGWAVLGEKVKAIANGVEMEWNLNQRLTTSCPSSPPKFSSKLQSWPCRTCLSSCRTCLSWSSRVGINSISKQNSTKPTWIAMKLCTEDQETRRRLSTKNHRLKLKIYREIEENQEKGKRGQQPQKCPDLLAREELMDFLW